VISSFLFQEKKNLLVKTGILGGQRSFLGGQRKILGGQRKIPGGQISHSKVE
jgi:hypothetical protein